MVSAVLFDLDGTFADTAPDLGGALNRQRKARGLQPLPLETIRPHASAGARGLLGVGFGIAPGDADYEAMRDEFLALYEGALCLESRLFDGIPELVSALESRGLEWGIVTNKAARFTLPLLDALGVRERARCIVSGDTCPQPKPHPAPLLAGSAALGIEPGRCLYVGDDERDTQASIAAGMRSVVARYGYLGGRPWELWGAHAAIESPLDLLALLPD
ncbi:MAG: HAD hydrolase-like protein [Burkholderiales bacterium]|nr:HAD hydrolase-like protein [Burkholderiales bacterium]